MGQKQIKALSFEKYIELHNELVESLEQAIDSVPSHSARGYRFRDIERTLLLLKALDEYWKIC